ncbi:hypothetical protein AGLY_017714 [Aphis glycines]|uniref:MADF domain-containing protein n=2 Tax=Aphis TaxID=464929 RepID=A0A6G0SW71_APHGL|nr:hypothetical protein AGLY_017714 [Aphis glycines]
MNEQLANIKFVEEVEKHELLYNYNLPGYSRKDLTEKAWHEIAAKVNMTAAECKEKWRNLRTVFTRKMKTPASGSDAMQFSVPFIKTLVPPSTGNLPEKPQDETTDETTENTEVCDDLTNSSYSELQPPPLPSSPSLEAPFLSPSASPASSVLSQQINHPEEQFSTSRNKKNLKFKNKSAAEADNCVAEYFKAKKARLEANLVTNSYNNENKEALKMFLLSLMPEVEHFNKDQIKLFKRKIFSVIDDISSKSSSTFSSPHTTSFPSTHTSQSTTSYTPESTPSNALEYYSIFSGTFENYDEERESNFAPL